MIRTFDMSVPEERTPYEDVLQLEDGESGASPRGSTYWRRIMMCPREHLLANLMQWSRTVRAKPLDWGLLWHGCLEAHYRAVYAQQNGWTIDKVPERYAFEFLQLFRDAKGWAEMYDGVTRMLEVYFERWKNADKDWEVLAVEYTAGWTKATAPQIVAQLGFELTTRLDLAIRDHSGLRPVVRHVEHKSSHALDPQTMLAYAMDEQVLGQCFLGKYAVGWRHLGCTEPYMGAIVNVTTKAKTPRCVRLPIQPSDEQFRAYAEAKRYWAWQAEQYAAVGYPRNYANCTRRWGHCEFYEACRQHPMDDLVQLRQKNVAQQLPVNYCHRNSVIDLEE